LPLILMARKSSEANNLMSLRVSRFYIGMYREATGIPNDKFLVIYIIGKMSSLANNLMSLRVSRFYIGMYREVEKLLSTFRL
jgi:hypothetical protein